MLIEQLLKMISTVGVRTYPMFEPFSSLKTIKGKSGGCLLSLLYYTVPLAILSQGTGEV